EQSREVIGPERRIRLGMQTFPARVGRLVVAIGPDQLGEIGIMLGQDDPLRAQLAGLGIVGHIIPAAHRQPALLGQAGLDRLQAQVAGEPVPWPTDATRCQSGRVLSYFSNRWTIGPLRW